VRNKIAGIRIDNGIYFLHGVQFGMPNKAFPPATKELTSRENPSSEQQLLLASKPHDFSSEEAEVEKSDEEPAPATHVNGYRDISQSLEAERRHQVAESTEDGSDAQNDETERINSRHGPGVNHERLTSPMGQVEKMAALKARFPKAASPLRAAVLETTKGRFEEACNLIRTAFDEDKVLDREPLGRKSLKRKAKDTPAEDPQINEHQDSDVYNATPLRSPGSANEASSIKRQTSAAKALFQRSNGQTVRGNRRDKQAAQPLGPPPMQNGEPEVVPSSSESSSDDDIESKPGNEGDRVPVQRPTTNDTPVRVQPSGKPQTRKRNERRRIQQRAIRAKSLSVASSSFLGPPNADAPTATDREPAEEDVEKLTPQKPVDTITNTITDPKASPAHSEQRRSRVDAKAAQRFILNGLGVSTPRNQQERERIKAKLAGNVRPWPNMRLLPPTVEPESSSTPAVVDKIVDWRSKIDYRAIDCGEEDLELSAAPFPFKQRWSQSEGRRRKREQQDQLQYDDGDGDAYDKPSKRRRLTPADPPVTRALEPEEDDLPPLPKDINSLPVLKPGQATQGMIITWVYWSIFQGASDCRSVTAKVTDTDHVSGSLTVSLAKRDRPVFGKNPYEDTIPIDMDNNDAEDDDGEEKEEEVDDGVRVITFSELQDPRVLKHARSGTGETILNSTNVVNEALVQETEPTTIVPERTMASKVNGTVSIEKRGPETEHPLNATAKSSPISTPVRLPPADAIPHHGQATMPSTDKPKMRAIKSGSKPVLWQAMQRHRGKQNNQRDSQVASEMPLDTSSQGSASQNGSDCATAKSFTSSSTSTSPGIGGTALNKSSAELVNDTRHKPASKPSDPTPAPGPTTSSMRAGAESIPNLTLAPSRDDSASMPTPTMGLPKSAKVVADSINIMVEDPESAPAISTSKVVNPVSRSTATAQPDLLKSPTSAVVGGQVSVASKSNHDNSTSTNPSTPSSKPNQSTAPGTASSIKNVLSSPADAAIQRINLLKSGNWRAGPLEHANLAPIAPMIPSSDDTGRLLESNLPVILRTPSPYLPLSGTNSAPRSVSAEERDVANPHSLHAGSSMTRVGVPLAQKPSSLPAADQPAVDQPVADQSAEERSSVEPMLPEHADDVNQDGSPSLASPVLSDVDSLEIKMSAAKRFQKNKNPPRTSQVLSQRTSPLNGGSSRKALRDLHLSQSQKYRALLAPDRSPPKDNKDDQRRMKVTDGYRSSSVSPASEKMKQKKSTDMLRTTKSSPVQPASLSRRQSSRLSHMAVRSSSRVIKRKSAARPARQRSASPCLDELAAYEDKLSSDQDQGSDYEDTVDVTKGRHGRR
jgi:hypothetical protein